MKRSLIAGLRCPACHAAIRLENGVFDGDVALEGQFRCEECSRVYPLREGAAYLAILDEAWGTILKELVNRRQIIEENIAHPAAPANNRKAQQDASVSTLTEACTREAMARLPATRPLRLLDCGAGMFETSAEFAAMGIDVVATETEISMVRYANFQAQGRGDPQPFEINGRRYHIRDPKGHAHYFSRVVSDIQRLPFADGFFDVAFCRAMLHHVDCAGRAIREMARVVRPGGRIIICAEPARSILDRPTDQQADAVDREEGMNEQAPTLLEYRRALARAADRITVQYWPFAQVGRTRRLFELLPYNYFRHLWPGEETSGWKWRKLLPVSCGVNLYARRDGRPAPSPRPASADGPPPITVLAENYIAFDQDKTAAALREGTEELKALRREVLARTAGRLPTRVEPGREAGLILESGWLEEGASGGEPFRFTARRASVCLRKPDEKQALRIRFGGGKAGHVYTFAVHLNGTESARFDGEGPAWREETIAIPRGIFDEKNPCVLQVEITNDSAPGVAIAHLGIV